MLNRSLFINHNLGLVYYVCRFLLLRKDSRFTFVGRETYSCYSVFKYILFVSRVADSLFAKALHDSSQYRQVCCLYN